MVTKLMFLGLLLVGFHSQSVFAHGEDRPGPHSGYIRMPGAFHTELVVKDPRELTVYLIDMDWENPTIQGSTVTAIVKRSKKDINLECKAAQSAFSCVFPTQDRLQARDKIVIEANRNGVVGGLAEYIYPLKR